MKVFLDTNIFVEYIFEREQFASVQSIFQALKNKQIEGNHFMRYILHFGISF